VVILSTQKSHSVGEGGSPSFPFIGILIFLFDAKFWNSTIELKEWKRLITKNSGIPKLSCSAGRTHFVRTNFYDNKLSQPQLNLKLKYSTHTTTFKLLPDNLGSWFSLCNLILTHLERQPQQKNWSWPKKNGRRPQKNENGQQPHFFLNSEWCPQIKIEDDLKKNGRWHKKNGRQLQKKM
jgi:hypothetical protein